MTFGGLPTRFEPEAASRAVAIIAPSGLLAERAAPRGHPSRAVQHGFTVQQLWWDTTTRSPDDPPEPWVRRHVAAAHAREDADRVLLVGKSLGTHAASYAAERGLDGWLSQI